MKKENVMVKLTNYGKIRYLDEESSEFSFMESDVIAAAKVVQLDEHELITINLYGGDLRSRVSKLQQTLARMEADNDTNKYIILFNACANKKDYPEDKYFLTSNNGSVIGLVKNIENKRPLPLDSILAQERVVATQSGFKSINYYVNYEFSEAFIYNNEAGKLIDDNFTGLIEEFNNEVKV